MTFILLHYVVESKPLAAFLSGSKDMDRDSRADALGKDKNIGWCIADIFKAKAAKNIFQKKSISENNRPVLCNQVPVIYLKYKI